MQEIYINEARLKKIRLDKEIISKIEHRTGSHINIDGGEGIIIENNDAYKEFLTSNIINAFGRGFEIDDALLLLNEDYYFSYIDLRQMFSSDGRISQIKSRIIGTAGKSKRYIQSVSGVKMSVYGHTIGFIGMTDQIEEAQAAVHTIIEGGTHKLAYQRMEASHRKHKDYMHIF